MSMKFYTEEEALDMVLGKKGTQLRDEYETELAESVKDILSVTAAEHKGGHTLLCTFSTGERKTVDLTPLLKYPAFEELKDEAEFMKFFVLGTVLWQNGASIVPEYLYENGIDA